LREARVLRRIRAADLMTARSLRLSLGRATGLLETDASLESSSLCQKAFILGLLPLPLPARQRYLLFRPQIRVP
jgi:hypothetical protein